MQHMYPDEFSNYRRFIKPIVVFLVVFIVALPFYEILHARQFHIISTDPAISNVATVSPFFKINFNKTLLKPSLRISSSYSVVKSYTVEGKVLTVSLRSPMTASYQYYIRINSVSDVDGDKVTNKMLYFTPKYIAPQDLSKDQQQVLLKQQAARPPSQANILFIGTDALINNGVTITQVNIMEQDFFQFKPLTKTVAISPSSVQAVPHNRNSASMSDTINFSVQVDSKPYNARVDYSLLDNTIRLYLYDPATGALAFDSANIPGME